MKLECFFKLQVYLKLVHASWCFVQSLVFLHWVHCASLLVPSCKVLIQNLMVGGGLIKEAIFSKFFLFWN
jgi:hypothetical protein